MMARVLQVLNPYPLFLKQAGNFGCNSSDIAGKDFY